VRDDPLKPKDYAKSDVWSKQRYDGRLVIPNSESQKNVYSPKSILKSNSLSGNERNRLFISGKNQFYDVTLNSGVDFREDGRGFSWIDFDQDGFLDMVVTSLAEPRVRMMRNQFAAFGAKRNVITFDLRGQNHDGKPSSTFSNRDAIGARLIVDYPSGKKLILQKQCGEGFSVQNSPLLRVTWSTGDFPCKVTAHWPSGRKLETILEKGKRHYQLTEPK